MVEVIPFPHLGEAGLGEPPGKLRRVDESPHGAREVRRVPRLHDKPVATVVE